MTTRPYLNQVYKDIKAECLRTGKLFTDDKFPPYDRSINIENSKNSYNTKWIRAKNLCRNPHFIVDGISRKDLNQGNLGDCWFISGIAAIAEVSEMRQKVIPDDQGFSKDYCGLFHFRFWQKGSWVDVVVDDYLPVDENNELAYLSNLNSKNEFWCCLLEKAYAKLYSCYELLEGGYQEDAMVDMTGGVVEVFDLTKIVKKQKTDKTKKHNTNVLWHMINKSFKMGSVCATSIWQKTDEKEAEREDGLVEGHAYTVTGMDEKLKIIRIRNPHGYGGSEWNGAWSDSSNKWRNMDDETKRRLNFRKKDDGEFWMAFDDFIRNYDTLSFSHINLNAYTEEQASSSSSNSHWDIKQYAGKLKARNKPIKDYRKLFWSNPQHVVNLTDAVRPKQMIVALMSTDYVEKRKQEEDYAPIMFHLFKVLGNGSMVKSRYDSDDLERVGKSNKLSYNARETTKRFCIKRGIYVIVPSSEDRAVEATYLLRVFTESVSTIDDEEEDDGELIDDDDENEIDDEEEDEDDEEDEDGDEDNEDDEDEDEDDDDEDDNEDDEDEDEKKKNKNKKK